MSLDLPNMPIFSIENIPQVNIEQLLEKYNGKKFVISADKKMIKYSITKFPKYLILNYKRISKNKFYAEKNSTIVNFPIIDLDIDKNKYDLISNIVHVGNSESDKYKIQVLHNNKSWYEISDIKCYPILPEDIFLKETYLQIFKRKDHE